MVVAQPRIETYLKGIANVRCLSRSKRVAAQYAETADATSVLGRAFSTLTGDYIHVPALMSKEGTLVACVTTSLVPIFCVERTLS